MKWIVDRAVIKRLLSALVKFAVTGLIGLIIDFSITWSLREQFLINSYVANAAGFIAAATNNFYVNKKWTFKDKSPRFLRQYIAFVAISVVGLLLNTVVLFVLFQYWKIPFYISKAFAIVIVFMWNFIANLVFTFKSPIQSEINEL